jgi:hypothetical protein
VTKATPAQPTDHRVFISYKRADDSLVEDLVDQLHKEGITIWWDRKDISPGQDWLTELESALGKVSAIAVFLGPDGLGTWQNREILKAVEEKQKREIPVIPVLLPGRTDELPLALKGFERTDLRNPHEYEKEFRRLVAAIKGDALSPAAEAEYIQRELRAAVLDYYVTQEALCEHLVFTPKPRKNQVKGSDLYVPLNLLVKRDEAEIPISDARSPNEDLRHIDTPPRERERTRGFWGRLFNKTSDLRNETASHELQSIWEPKSWAGVFWDSGLRLAFTGDAGSGKSFSLNQEIRKRLSHARNELENFRPLDELELPILVKANVLVSTSQEKVADILLANLQDLSRSKHFQNWWRHAFNSEQGRRLFIIIDGLDELPETPEIENRFRERMRELHELQSANLIVSCRTAYFWSRKYWISWGGEQFKEIRIAPLDEKQQLELIEKWFADSDHSSSVRSLIETNYAARTLCRTPVVLTLICNTEAIAEKPTEQTYASLYNLAMEELFAGGWRDSSERPKWTINQTRDELRAAGEARRILVSRIGWELFEKSSSENRFTKTEWMKAADQISQTHGEARVDPMELFNDLLRVGVLADAGRSEEWCYSFAHRTVYEFFAAAGLVEQEATWIKTIVKHMWCENRWQEVIRFAASMPGKSGNNSQALLRAIASETGTDSTPSRPLQWLSLFCCSSAIISLFALVILGLLAGVFIENSPAVSQQLKEYLERTYAKSAPPSRTVLTQSPVNTLGSIANHCRAFYRVAMNSFSREILAKTTNEPGFYLAFTWLQFLFPVLLIPLPISLLGAFLSSLSGRILYRRSFLSQDDIFRTGLRIQAEIVGLNPVIKDKPHISRSEVTRVVRSLIASERTKSLNIHGATEEGGIPENLVLLLGGNIDARTILERKFWLPLVNLQTRKLRRRNQWYERFLSGYGWWLNNLTRPTRDVLFNTGDLRDVYRTSWFSIHGTSLSSYVEGRLKSDRRGATLPENRSDWSKEQYHEFLLPHLNAMLRGPSLFSSLNLDSGDLRAETIELLERQPAGAELIHLNRLLLEDAFPRAFRRLQKRSVRFISWWFLQMMKACLLSGMLEARELDVRSDLGLALRGLILLPNVSNRNDILCLLQETIRASNHLIKAGETARTFTALDIYLSKILAITGTATDRERLVELANRLSEGNPDTPLAVKELSSIDQRQGILTAAACLSDGWQEKSYAGYSRQSEFVEVLQNCKLELVADELVRLNLDSWVLWDKILLPLSIKYQSDAAKDFLHQIANCEVFPSSVRKIAEDRLHSPHYKDLFYTIEWLEEYAEKIRTSVENGHTHAAALLLNESISSYSINYSSNNLAQALDKIAAVCNEELLKNWFKNEEVRYGRWRKCLVLARLGRGANGTVVEEALIEWVNSLRVDSIDSYGIDPREGAIQVLGELGTRNAAVVLIATLKRTITSRQRPWRRSIYSPDQMNLFWTSMLAALGKVETTGKLDAFERDEVSKAIQLGLKARKNWVAYHVAARSISARNPVDALRLLLQGHVRRDKERWQPEYGIEPQLHDFAFACHARIRKISQEGTWYVVTSPAFKGPIRVRA